MTKPLPRRSILKALAALPIAIEQAEQAAVGATVGVAEAGAGVDAALGGVPAPMILGGAKSAELLALSKAGALPGWMRRAIGRHSRYYGGGTLDPDVACLRSVSMGAKLSITARRRAQRAEDNFERDLIDHQMQAQFMGWAR